MNKNSTFIVKDYYSSLTHFIGCILSVFATPFLIGHAVYVGKDFRTICGLLIFMTSMIVLYGASASYHAFNISDKGNRILKKIDHCSVFILIAGSYTPICLSVLDKTEGLRLLMVVWGIAIAGIIFKLFWVFCPRYVSSILYIFMGWVCIGKIGELYHLLGNGFYWLLLGGIFYSVGGIIYAIKKPFFKNEAETGFGNHELFHIFILLGSLCHYITMMFYI